MVPEGFHDFFLGTASVAGALVGLLFVALSVARDHPVDPGAEELRRLRAVGAFSAFSNSLVLSLWALLPHTELGYVATSMALVGLGSVIGSVIALVRITRADQRRRRMDGAFVATLLVIFAGELISGLVLVLTPRSSAALTRIGDIVIVGFLVGIARAWELVGGPQVTIRAELAELRRETGIQPGPARRSTATESIRDRADR